MVPIMASGLRLTGVLAAAWCAGAAAAQTTATTGFSPLPAGYSLSYDKDRWNEAFSVFHMAVVDTAGVLGSGVAASDDPRLRPLTRLDTSWIFAKPLAAAPLRVGDAVSSAGLWNDPARLGGVQWGTLPSTPPEVSVPPAVVASPFASLGPKGLAASSNQFIDRLRAQVQIQTQTLAVPGQSLYSLEAGRLREQFELRSNDYGPWITSGTYRYGVNAATTLDGQLAQVGAQQSFLGVGVLEGLGPLGLLSARVAGSHEFDGTGWVARMGYDFAHERLSIAIRSHVQSVGFQDVGDASVSEALRQRTLASARVDFGPLGKLSLASATQTATDDSRRDIVALSHAMPFGGGGVMSTAAAYSPGPWGSSAILLSFTYPFAHPGTGRSGGAVDSALDRSLVDALGQTRNVVGGAWRPGNATDTAGALR